MWLSVENVRIFKQTKKNVECFLFFFLSSAHLVICPQLCSMSMEKKWSWFVTDGVVNMLLVAVELCG